MNFQDIVLKNRSYRRFDQSQEITMSQLKKWIDLARITPSGANLQPLKYALVSGKEKCAEVFTTLKWAGYLPEWDGPVEGERPTAYIVVLQDKEISANLMGDQGIPVQTILLGAVEDGYGGCVLGAVDRVKLKEILDIPNEMEIVWVIALGVPNEEIHLTKVEGDGSIKYYRDANTVHFVPKRSLEEILAREFDR